MQKSTFNPPSVFNSLQYGFSQAVEVRGGRRLLLSGQVGVDVLAEAGGELSHVVMLRIYIAEAARDQQEWISQVLLQRFPNDPPASSWIIVSGLSLPEWLIEVEAEAMLPERQPAQEAALLSPVVGL